MRDPGDTKTWTLPLCSPINGSLPCFTKSRVVKNQGEKFKPQAYAKAAHAIQTLREDIADISRQGKTQEIPGIGTHLAAKIEEIITTGWLNSRKACKRRSRPGAGIC